MNTTEHKANMNITKIDKYKKTEQQFYNGDKTDMKTTKNWTPLLWPSAK